MRSIGTLPHTKFRIEVYALEQHLYVEINAGPMKQCYKFKKDTCANLQELAALMDDAFYSACYTQFEEMYKAQTAAINRFNA